MKKSSILIINPLTSGEYCNQRLAELGYAVLNFYAVDHHEEYASAFNNDPFAYKLASKNNIEVDIKNIEAFCEANQLKLITGFPGREFNYEYSNLLLATLFPESSNRQATMSFRCNKYHMQEALKQCSLPFIDHVNFAKQNYDESTQKMLTDFLERHQKIIIKPESDSALNHGVKIVSDPETMQEYIANYQSGEYANANILVEKYLSGQEYYIDAASYAGKTIICGIGYADKQVSQDKMKSVYKQALSINDPMYTRLANYTQGLIKIVDMRYGLSHIEVIHAADDNIYLLEINPRVSGGNGIINRMNYLAYGYDQLDAFIALLENKILEKKTQNKIASILVLYGLTQIEYQQFLEVIPNLQSYVEHQVYKIFEEKIVYNSLQDASIMLLQAHTDLEVISQERVMLLAQFDPLGDANNANNL
jgi:biotin carboxylase